MTSETILQRMEPHVVSVCTPPVGRPAILEASSRRERARGAIEKPDRGEPRAS